MILRLVLLALWLALPIPALARTFYVDPDTGVNTQDGTNVSTPWENPPGTRIAADNSGYVIATWEAGASDITTGNKVACGDTIFLKGGTTHDNADGGAYRISGDYYTDCTASSVITITVAKSSDWSGASGAFTFNGDNIAVQSLQYLAGGNGVCSSGAICVDVSIEQVGGIIFGGQDAASTLIVHNIENEFASTSGSAGAIMADGSGASTTGRVEIRYVEVHTKIGDFDAGAAVSFGDIHTVTARNVWVHDWEGPGVDTGHSSLHRVRGLLVMDYLAENQGAVFGNCTGGSNDGADCTVATQATDCTGGGTCTYPNATQDCLSFAASEYDTSLVSGGGAYCLRCQCRDGYWNGTNSGGCNTIGIAGFVRYRDTTFEHQGRTDGGGASARVNLESSGDACGSGRCGCTVGADCGGGGVCGTDPNVCTTCCTAGDAAKTTCHGPSDPDCDPSFDCEAGGTYGDLPEPSLWFLYSTLYNGFTSNQGAPHGSGSVHMWNSIFYRQEGSGSSGNVLWDRCATVGTYRNNILSPGSSTLRLWSSGSCGDPQSNYFTPPDSDYNIYVGNASGDTFSTWDTQCATDAWLASAPVGWVAGPVLCRADNAACGGGELCRMRTSTTKTFGSPPGFVGANDQILIGAAADGLFVSEGGNCDVSGYNTRQEEDCNFNLGGSNGVDDGACVLKANGAGSGATITVKAGTPEPYMVGASAMGGGRWNWTGDERPENDDPRTYFIDADGYPSATSDVITIAGCGDVTVTDMTATTITMSPSCGGGWADNACIHFRYAGSAPDVGRYETGLSGGTTTVPAAGPISRPTELSPGDRPTEMSPGNRPTPMAPGITPMGWPWDRDRFWTPPWYPAWYYEAKLHLYRVRHRTPPGDGPNWPLRTVHTSRAAA